MKTARCLLLAAVAIASAAAAGPGAAAQTKASANTLKLDSEANMPRATLEEVAWIAGHWMGNALGGVAEEVWSEPEAGSMMGMFRLVKDEKVVFYEFFALVEENGSLVLKLKHFGPDLAGWEERDKFVRFPLVRVTPREAYFDGMTFRRLDDGSLQVFVLVRKKSGETVEEEFRYVPRERWKPELAERARPQ